VVYFLLVGTQLVGTVAVGFACVRNALAFNFVLTGILCCTTQYDCGKLGESNKDALDNDLLGLIKSSGDKLLTHLFGSVELQSGGSTVASAGTRIRQQCQLLVTALMECSPHYVRW
jgi:hypothetical protein